MSETLRRKLQALEEDYLEMPPVVRSKDLPEINRIRAELGMPLVDDHLKEVNATRGTEVVTEPVDSQPAADSQAAVAPTEPLPTEEVVDYTEAREIYNAYLAKVEALKPHWAYAKRVAKATTGRGQTPVGPLATMGTDGGPLLCDQCGKAILLEGGKYNNVRADVAWRRDQSSEEDRAKWTSWILGGMVVEVQTNGTLRVYHGYPGRDNNHCCNIAARDLAKARAKFDTSKRSKIWPQLLAFLQDEFPDLELQERTDLLNKILDVMFEYDPGIGINRPSEEES